MQEIDVVVGAGISGLLAALLLSDRNDRKVVIIEREGQVGGLLRCFEYGRFGVFDYGMHNMYETGIGPLDDLLFGLLPKTDWQILEKNKRDLAGVVFNGIVQYNSPFPDLRSLPSHQWEACVLGFFKQIECRDFRGNENALDVAISRFGDAIAGIIDTALRKQFGKEARELSPFATHLTTLSRVVMFSEEVCIDLLQSSILRDNLAWPEQRTLPARWASGRRAYYPKKYGIYRVVEALLARLEAAGVQILTNAQVESIDVNKCQVNELTVACSGEKMSIGPVKTLVWTSGLPALAPLLGINLAGYRFDPPRKTVVVNLLLRRPPEMGDLYYLYCYEPECHTFRVTNFSAYCEGAPRSGGWPVAVELLLDNPLPSIEVMKLIALEELKQFKIIAANEDVIFAAVEPLGSGFPMPSVNNFETLASIRESISSINLNNLMLLGIMSEENIFFQRDVLAQTWRKLA